jgi:LysR family glycine cleavage system transcriptional activator
MHRLPPLNAVRAFEAAARCLSFKQAGAELHVTPGAISRHIAKLEDFLGTRLFVRRHRQVILTKAGERYLRDVRDGLERIGRATAAIGARLNDKVLRLKLPPTFAVRWLVPRLGRFHGHHPEISVQVTTSHEPVDFDNEEVDAAVGYGTALGPELAGERLFNEALIPVCRPGLATRARSSVPAALADMCLLHSSRRPDDWPRWFAAAGAPGIPLKQPLVFENSSMTYQGAVDGLGVAMAQIAFVADELRTGRLVCPLPVRLNGRAAYFLSYPKERAGSAALRAFHRWIAREALRTRRELAAELSARSPPPRRMTYDGQERVTRDTATDMRNV